MPLQIQGGFQGIVESVASFIILVLGREMPQLDVHVQTIVASLITDQMLTSSGMELNWTRDLLGDMLDTDFSSEYLRFSSDKLADLSMVVAKPGKLGSRRVVDVKL